MMETEYVQHSDEYKKKLDNAKDYAVKRSMMLIDGIVVVKILRKKGYSWVDTETGISIDLENECITDSEGTIMFEWE